MGNNARDILKKYERENKERAESGNVYALKDSTGRYLRNRKSRLLIQRIKNPVLEAVVKIVMITLLIVLVVWTIFSIITYFNDFKNFAGLL